MPRHFAELIANTSMELRDNVGLSQWQFTELCEKELGKLVSAVIIAIEFEIDSKLDEIVLDLNWETEKQLAVNKQLQENCE